MVYNIIINDIYIYIYLLYMLMIPAGVLTDGEIDTLLR